VKQFTIFEVRSTEERVAKKRGATVAKNASRSPDDRPPMWPTVMLPGHLPVSGRLPGQDTGCRRAAGCEVFPTTGWKPPLLQASLNTPAMPEKTYVSIEQHLRTTENPEFLRRTGLRHWV